jgi:hypothetical protein
MKVACAAGIAGKSIQRRSSVLQQGEYREL